MRRNQFNRGIGRIIKLSMLAQKEKLSISEALDRFDDSEGERQRRLWTRRNFIQKSAAGIISAAIPLGACKTLSNKSSLQSERGDIVILGGGLAGLTCAYRLYQAGISSSLYEASDRLGGRVLSARNFNVDNQFCELGAELVDSTNLELIELAREIGLQTEGYADHDPVNGEGELFFYNGKIFTEKELFLGLRPLVASVADDIKNIFPDGNVFWPSYSSKNSPILIRFDNMSLDEYFFSKAALTDKWIMNVLRKAYETEYGGALARQSALNFICLADTKLDDGFTWYGASDEWGRVKGGNQGMIDGLQSRLSGKIPLEMNHELISIAHNGSQFTLNFNSGGATKEVRARQVVCALPFSVLRKIDGIKKLGLSKLKERSINEFSYGTNAKFMSSYKERVWRNKGSSSIPPSQAAVITDLEGGQYWETSRIQSGKSGIITNFLGGLQGAKVTESHMNTILSDLNTLWPGLASLHDGKSVLKAWTREKYAMGSYSSPGPGQYTSFIGVEGEPELNNKLLFIGEHTSPDWIGYMNGAIQTGNDAALMISGEKLSNLTDRGHGRLSVSSTREARRWKSQNVW